MMYWLGVSMILLIGYVLIKAEEKANDIKSKGNGGRATRATATDLGVRAATASTHTRETGNASKNESYNGGKE